MSVQVASNRFIVSSICLKQPFSYQTLGEMLTHEAETAQAFRNVEKLEEIGLVLSNFPLKEYRLVGQYYIAWCAQHKGVDARGLFEALIEESPTRPMALIELATIEARNGKFDSGITYYQEAIKHSDSPYVLALAKRSIAAIESIEGSHDRALKDLESFSSLIPYIQPIERYQYLNSLAVEFSHTGRIQEAGNVCKIILASPYAFAYPEWRETSNDIALRGYKSRSVIYFNAWNVARNVLYLPENTKEESTQDQPGTVSALEDWKKKMVKEPNGEDELPENMSRQDMAMKILEVITEHKDDDEKLRQLLDYAMKLFSK